MFRDGDDRIWRGIRLAIKSTLLSLDASVAHVPIKQRRSERQFDRVPLKLLMPFANVRALIKHYAFIVMISIYDHSVDTCSMILKNFSYRRCPMLTITNFTD